MDNRVINTKQAERSTVRWVWISELNKICQSPVEYSSAINQGISRSLDQLQFYLVCSFAREICQTLTRRGFSATTTFRGSLREWVSAKFFVFIAYSSFFLAEDQYFSSGSFANCINRTFIGLDVCICLFLPSERNYLEICIRTSCS